MSKLLNEILQSRTKETRSRTSAKFLLSEASAALKYIHQTGVEDNPIQRVAFNPVERAVYSNILGDLPQQKHRAASRRRNLNWGKYIQNHDSPDLIPNLSKTHKSLLVPEDVIHVPYPHMSLDHVKMKAVAELIQSTGFFVIATVGEGLEESFRKNIVENHIQDCQKFNVKALAIKPILFRACLWNLSVNDQSLDEFWTKGFLDSHRDALGDKLLTKHNVERENGRGTLIAYFFEFNNDSHSVLEEVFESYHEVCLFLGGRISPEVVGGSKHLKETLSNINTPWVLTGDENTKSLAKVLQGLASLGLVDSSKAPKGAIYVL